MLILLPRLEFLDMNSTYGLPQIISGRGSCGFWLIHPQSKTLKRRCSVLDIHLHVKSVSQVFLNWERCFTFERRNAVLQNEDYESIEYNSFVIDMPAKKLGMRYTTHDAKKVCCKTTCRNYWWLKLNHLKEGQDFYLLQKDKWQCHK